jgi:hypothetical protein
MNVDAKIFSKMVVNWINILKPIFMMIVLEMQGWFSL